MIKVLLIIFCSILAVLVIVHYWSCKHWHGIHSSLTLSPTTLSRHPFQHGDVLVFAKRRLAGVERFFHPLFCSILGTPFMHTGLVVEHPTTRELDLCHYVKPRWQPKYPEGVVKMLGASQRLQCIPLSIFFQRYTTAHIHNKSTLVGLYRHPRAKYINPDTYWNAMVELSNTYSFHYIESYVDMFQSYVKAKKQHSQSSWTKPDATSPTQIQTMHCILFVSKTMEAVHLLPPEETYSLRLLRHRYMPDGFQNILKKNDFEYLGTHQFISEEQELQKEETLGEQLGA